MKSLLIPTFCLMAIAAVARAAGPADLIRLYEEEILAHDLYVILGKKHPDVRPFQNIPRSEQMHRDALAAILKSEGIAVPKAKKGRRFVSEGLDEIFAKWRAEGKKSAAAACGVGVRLEDHDIADLRKAQADFPKHKEVLGQLEAASNNHFRAFHRNLTVRGGEYAAEALTAADIKVILDGENECGGCAGACKTETCGPQGGGAGNGPGGRGRGNGNGNGPGGNGNGRGWRGGR
jgi:hypothetical protein